MPQLIASSCETAIVGAGVTGVSVARFLARRGQAFTLLDTRPEHPQREALEREFGAERIQFGPLDVALLSRVEEVVVSPGIAMSTPELQQARNAGARLVGDIELFVRFAKAPLIAITGSNAKSTVTTLVGEMARDAGVRVAVGGNLGTPALDLLDDSIELYVLELSSFQLEGVSKLSAKVATVLNVSADHMDRYPNMPAYHQAKLRVYFGAEQVVYNSQSVLTQPPMSVNAIPITFGGRPEFHRFGVAEHEGEPWLYWQLEPLMPASELRIKGRHNIDNALAALALGHSAGFSHESMLNTLRRFRGLPHRCEWVAEHDGVGYYNDSKGTNVGAAVAAIEGLAPATGKIVLIAGGDPKGADFTELRKPVERCVRTLVLIGTAAEEMATVLGDLTDAIRADSMTDAVRKASAAAQAGDVVLLSPACASFDMFRNYQDRGEQFRRAVEARL
ncbi:UDP-N-acetylmuramoyl-L-alanine--D-glutamate ligase [Marinimicrobium sp. C6131]|uniref:UDP-N-acetylmuramoyl-L-alanine--D-glutamate ligase n=1 Tax=Marinimicrobium sp. C6131 TaxID=3022676 RepID=UPI00223D24CF|nr:UDP-N-acetylmuramoyl-L-alanine--D-glutamate ligase [Marinimicrobium sp. C6131]UZJ46081.1 UDP-N-acetylmuramoyl-L-alanine--D-glutamate ligase [Marinimicrobium sp. C6131]